MLCSCSVVYYIARVCIRNVPAHPISPYTTLPTVCSDRPTHWKQDLLLLDSPLHLEEGQRLKGTIKLTRHKLWRRHLRVTLTYSLWKDDTELNEVQQ